MKILNKIKEIYRKLNPKKPEIKDIWKFNPEENPGPTKWKAHGGAILEIPSLSLLFYGCYNLGWIEVKEYKKVKYPIAKDVDSVLRLDPEFIKKTTCINLVMKEKTKRIIDFWGIKGREIPLSEVLRLEEKYFCHDKDYIEYIDSWKYLSKENKEILIEKSIDTEDWIHDVPPHGKSLSKRKYILPLLPQEYVYKICYESLQYKICTPHFLLRYFNDPIYLNLDKDLKEHKITDLKSKTDYITDDDFGFIKEAVNQGWFYLHINFYTLKDITVDSLRKILKSQLPRTKELQTNCFKTWIKNNSSGVVWNRIIKSSKNLHLREKLLLLFKYTKLYKEEFYNHYYSILLNDEEYYPSYFYKKREVNKRIEKYDWYSDKILEKIISISPNNFLVNYPTILLKNLKKDNSSIFDAISVLHDAVTKSMKSSNDTERLSGLFCMKWLKNYFNQNICKPGSKNWERVDNFVKDYISSCIDEQLERMETYFKDKNPIHITIFGRKINISVPMFSKTISFVGKDFNITILKNEYTKDCKRVVIPVETVGQKKKIHMHAFHENGYFRQNHEEWNGIPYITCLEEHNWFFLCVRELGVRLDSTRGSVTKVDNYPDSEGRIEFTNVLSKIPGKENGLELRENFWRIIGVYHSPSKTLFSGFKSESVELIVNKDYDSKESNSNTFKKIIAELEHLTDISDYIITHE